MDQQTIVKFANGKLVEHGLMDKGWGFCFMKRSRHIGLCQYRYKLIRFSTLFLGLPEDEVKDTILHEIAHALTPQGCKPHGIEWQRQAITVGAKPQRCKNASSLYPEVAQTLSDAARYILECPACNHKVSMFRRPRLSRSCGKCSPRKFNENYKMVLTRR